ncbi:UNC93-like protein MFSD11 isoform X2 [Nematostella vectensis]|uniref:UNC93-like protein MFSD11 isoform X2 n=1 Tax=Nematostella vectensis TaxID=45351 RepID=UPI0020776564|nr:UNC93-like protein MFSD11 isoform X2 [Nematostella vectensis]
MAGLCDVRFWNVIVMGFSFMFVFTAFQTTSIIEPSVLQAARNVTNGTFTGDGYVSLGIVYSVFTFSNWVAPSVVGFFGPRASMIAGGICYLLFILALIEPKTWTLYLGSVIIGFGASIIWTGQGNFLTINSDKETMPRNSGIFWALLQCSLLFGNLFVYFEFKGSTIDDATRRTVFIVFSVVCGIGIGMMFLMRRVQPSTKQLTTHHEDAHYRSESDSYQDNSDASPKNSGVIQAFLTSIRLFITRDMMLLSLCFAYTGLELTFFSGVYGTCVGNTQQLPNSKKLIGLTGMFIGVGEIIGGLTFGIFGKRTNRFGRDPIVLFGLFIHWVAFILIFLNIPSDAPTGGTMKVAYLHAPNQYVVLLCGFLLGLGDSSYNTQIYSLLGSTYFDIPHDLPFFSDISHF